MSRQDNAFFGTFAAILGFLVVFAVVIYFIARSIGNAQAATDENALLTQVIEENIKPVGTVVVADESGATAAGGDTAAAAAPRAGDEVYNSACMACHATGAAGAPKVGDTAAWAPRIDQGMDTLMQHSIDGLRAMPPRGTCANCSDDDLKAAVIYMVEHSQ